jgi:acyl-coenzyme A thioesterase PaaI-like protein
VYRESLAEAANPPPSLAGAVRLADAVRRLIAVTTASTANDDLLGQMATQVDELASRLQAHALESRYMRRGGLVAGPGSFSNHPIVGPLNPFAPKVTMAPSADHLVGSVVYGPPYEGPNGFVHGGQIAAGFDAICAMTAGIEGRAGLTKWLRVDFLKPTPLNSEVTYVGVVDERRDRSTTVQAELRAGDVVCARGASEQVMRRTR